MKINKWYLLAGILLICAVLFFYLWKRQNINPNQSEIRIEKEQVSKSAESLNHSRNDPKNMDEDQPRKEIKSVPDQSEDRIDTKVQLRKLEKALNDWGGDPDRMDENQLRKLMESVSAEEKNIAQLMVIFAAQHKAVSLDRIERFGVLAQQIQGGRNDELKHSLHEMLDINELTTSTGQNLLMFALGVGATLEILNILIDSGINVNAVDDKGNTAAHLVLLWGSPDYASKIDFLRHRGADLQIQNKDGFSVDDMLRAREDTRKRNKRGSDRGSRSVVSDQSKRKV